MILCTGDLHLTGAVSDAYRWLLFPWLVKTAKRNKVTDIFILGDLTHSKDHHPASLVNKVVRSVKKLAAVAKVHIIMGNHDYVDKRSPFFKVLGDLPGVRYYTKPTRTTVAGLPCYLLPHSDDVLRDWPPTFPNRYVFFHQALIGAESENGTRLKEGLGAGMFQRKLAVGGDIHVPQEVVKGVHYVGAPYPINFGDTYTPRVLLLHKGVFKSIKVPTIAKRVATIKDVEELDDLTFNEGDQLRVIVRLRRRDMYRWKTVAQEVKEWGKSNDVDIRSLQLKEIKAKAQLKEGKLKEVHLSNPELLGMYCEQNGVDQELVDLGLELLK